MYSSYSKVPGCALAPISTVVVCNTLTVELWVLSVERELGPEVVDVFADETAVAFQSISAAGGSLQTVEPLGIGLRLLEDYGVTLLQDFVDGDEGLESLDLVGHDGLAVA